MTIRDDVLQAVRAFLKSMATLTDGQVLAGQQTGARPVAAYLTATVLSCVPAQTSALVWGTRVQGSGEQAVTLDTSKQSRLYVATVSVQAFGPTAIGWLEGVVNDLDSPAALALQAAAGYDIVSIGPVDNENAVLDGGWVERAGHDFEVRFRYSGGTRDTNTIGSIQADITTPTNVISKAIA